MKIYEKLSANSITPDVHKMVKYALKIWQLQLQSFKHVFDHFADTKLYKSKVPDSMQGNKFSTCFRDDPQILLLILGAIKKITFISAEIIRKPFFLIISGGMEVN